MITKRGLTLGIAGGIGYYIGKVVTIVVYSTIGTFIGLTVIEWIGSF